MAKRVLDCLFVGILKDYGRPDLDYSHEYLNLWTGLHEHPRLSARAFHPDVEAREHGPDGMRARFADLLGLRPPELLIHQPFTPELDPDLDAVQDLGRRGVPTVEWDADSSWRFDEFVRPRIQRYTLFVTTHRGSLPRYREAGADVHLSQWAVSSRYGGFRPGGERSVGVSFCGRTHGRRKDVIKDLRRRGVAVDCWGPGWTFRRGLLPRLRGRGRNHGYVAFPEMLAAIGSSRISLNLSNASGERGGSQIKGRHFEIPALGACQLTAPADGLEEHYEPGREVVVAEPGEGMSEAVRALQRDPARRLAVAEAGWKRTWAEHTWERRIDGILAHLGL